MYREIFSCGAGERRLGGRRVSIVNDEDVSVAGGLRFKSGG